jgi:hypothetical protein
MARAKMDEKQLRNGHLFGATSYGFLETYRVLSLNA